MEYGLIQTVAQPIEAYEQLHAQIGAASGGSVPGLLVHFARSTDQGYQVVEVWESKEHSDRFFEQVINPLLERFPADQPLPRPVVEEFEVHGLMTPAVPAAPQEAPSGR
jgi:hypothetical protein